MCTAVKQYYRYCQTPGALWLFLDILYLLLEYFLDQHIILKQNVCSWFFKSSTVNVIRLQLLLFKTQNSLSQTEPNQLSA